MTRRDLLARLARVGIGGAAAAGLLAGCGGDDSSSSNNNNDSLPYSGTLTRANTQMRSVIEQYLALNPTPIYNLTPQQARLQPSIADAVKAVLVAQGKSTAPQPVASVTDTTVPGPAGALPVRVYTPTGTGPLPVIVYFHGGGFVIATIDTYDASCRALANAAGAIVISVEYRKGPENKFPAAHEDAYAATQYIIANAAQFGGNPARVAVTGESAGGNLASAVCLLARQRGGAMPVYQALVYPVTNNDMTTPSYQANANAVPLSKPALQFFFNNYLNTPADGANPILAILKADVTGLPPATVITDDIDPLMSEGQAYAQKLQSAGIFTRYQNYPGVTHEFFGTGAVVDVANQAVAYVAAGLKTAFT